VTADDAIGDERGNFGILVAAVLDVVQRIGPCLQPLLVLVVPLGHAGVKIPAVIVETRGVGNLADLVWRLAGEVTEPDHDVGNLDAGVVDVVLHLDWNAPVAQHTDERVSKSGVPQVPDVRSLVGINSRMLDDGLAVAVRAHGGGRREPVAQERRTIEKEVEIAI
jgi:hypothetical protein